MAGNIQCSVSTKATTGTGYKRNVVMKYLLISGDKRLTITTHFRLPDNIENLPDNVEISIQPEAYYD
jgi:hypothetical protein